MNFELDNIVIEAGRRMSELASRAIARVVLDHLFGVVTPKRISFIGLGAAAPGPAAIGAAIGER